MKKRNRIALIILMALCLLLPLNVTAAPKKTPGYVTLTKISAPAYNKIKINWKKTSNATHYKVYYRKSGTKKWIGVKTLSNKSSSYTHKSSSKRPIIVGQKYDYTVRAYNKKYKTYGKYNTKGLTTKTKPNTVVVRGACFDVDKVYVYWDMAYGCDKYKVYRKTSKNAQWEYLDTVDESTRYYFDTNPIKGKTNYYTVKSYYSKTKTYGNYDKTGCGDFVPGNGSSQPEPEKPKPEKPSPSPNPDHQNPSGPVKVQSISFENPSMIELGKIGDTVQLKAKVLPENATNKKLQWLSMDSGIVSVDQNGLVTAVGYGNGYIKVKSTDGSNKSKTCCISIKVDTEAYAREVLELCNKERAKKGLQPFKTHFALQQGAMLRAKELEQYYSHNRPNGENGGTASERFGAGHIKGENIAKGFVKPEEVVNCWMESAGHRKEILKRDNLYLGVGVHEGADGVYYWVQTFAGEHIDKKVSATLNVNGGNCHTNKISIPYRARITQSDLPIPTKDGYMFKGWSVQNNTVPFKYCVMNVDMSFTALWE